MAYSMTRMEVKNFDEIFDLVNQNADAFSGLLAFDSFGQDWLPTEYDHMEADGEQLDIMKFTKANLRKLVNAQPITQFIVFSDLNEKKYKYVIQGNVLVNIEDDSDNQYEGLNHLMHFPEFLEYMGKLDKETPLAEACEAMLTELVLLVTTPEERLINDIFGYKRLHKCVEDVAEQLADKPNFAELLRTLYGEAIAKE